MTTLLLLFLILILILLLIHVSPNPPSTPTPLSTSASIPTNTPPLETLLKTALTDQTNQNFPSALSLSHYQTILALHPEHAEANHLLGLTLHSLDDNVNAVDYILNAFEYSKTDGSVTGLVLSSTIAANLGEIYRVLNDVSSSLHYLNLAIKYNPSNPLAYYNLVVILPRSSIEYHDALIKIVELDGTNVDAFVRLGRYWCDQSDHLTSLEYYMKAVDMEGGEDAMLGVAVAYTQLGNLAAAEEFHAGAINIKSFPESKGALLLIPVDSENSASCYSHYESHLLTTANMYNSNGLLQKSLNQLRLLSSSRPYDARVRNSLGAVLQQMQMLTEAEVELELAVSLDPLLSVGYNNLGVVLKGLNRPQNALNNFLKAYDIASNWGSYNREIAELSINNAANSYRDNSDFSSAYMLLCGHVFSVGRYSGMGICEEKLDVVAVVCYLALLEPQDYREHDVREAWGEGSGVWELLQSVKGESEGEGDSEGVSGGERMNVINNILIFMEHSGKLRSSGIDASTIYRKIARIPKSANDVYDKCSIANEDKKINVISQFNLSTTKEHQNKAALLAITMNYMNPCIKRLYIFVENDTDLKWLDFELVQSGIFPIGGNTKIVYVRHDKRMTFKDAFQFSNDELKGEVVVLANADIGFDSSLFNLVGDDAELGNEVFALSRWELVDEFVTLKDKEDDGRIGYKPIAEKLLANNNSNHNINFKITPRIDSQDSWIFTPPLNQGVVDASDFYQGLPRCDTRLAFILRGGGYEVRNPCVAVRSLHLEFVFSFDEEGGSGSGGGGRGGGGTYEYDPKINVKGECESVLISVRWQ